MIQQCLLMGFAEAVGGGGPTGTLLEDHFADPDGTDLLMHTMDTGPGWSVTPGSAWNIHSGAVEKTANAGVWEICYADAGSADVTITVKLTAGTDATIGLAGRIVDTDHYFLLYIASGTFILFDHAGAGVFNSLGSGSYIGSGSYPVILSLVFSGTSIKASVNGSTVLSVTSAVRQAATLHGLAFNQTTNGQLMDDFLVTSP